MQVECPQCRTPAEFEVPEGEASTGLVCAECSLFFEVRVGEHLTIVKSGDQLPDPSKFDEEDEDRTTVSFDESNKDIAVFGDLKTSESADLSPVASSVSFDLAPPVFPSEGSLPQLPVMEAPVEDDATPSEGTPPQHPDSQSETVTRVVPEEPPADLPVLTTNHAEGEAVDTVQAAVLLNPAALESLADGSAASLPELSAGLESLRRTARDLGARQVVGLRTTFSPVELPGSGPRVFVLLQGTAIR
jgi:hypothetical protein